MFLIEMDFPVKAPEVAQRELPHPLTIHLIAESIFSHLESTHDLMSCRQLAWTWRQMMTPMINPRSQELRRITFSGSEAKTGNQKNNPDATSSHLSKLSNYMSYLEEESEMEPKLQFSHFRFYNLPLEQPIVQQFLDKFGQTIRKLELGGHVLADYREFDKQFDFSRNYEERSRRDGSVASLWRLLGTQCTQLEELKFGQVNFQPTNEDTFLPFCSKIKRLTFIKCKLKWMLHPLIKNLLRNCHLLERLILKDVKNSLGVLSFALCKSLHLSALKELTMDDVRLIENLTHDENIRNLKLKKLQIQNLVHGDMRRLNLFLQTQKTSLEILIVDAWHFRYQHGGIYEPVKFLPSADVMEKLREFRIRFAFEEVPWAFHLIDFQWQFPCLNKLILEGDASKLPMDSLFVAGIEPQLTLEGLQLPWGISQQHLARAGKIFPNVKELRIGQLGELEMRQLFTQWPGLESLFLQEFEGHDSILTGIRSLKLIKVDLFKMTVESEANPSIVAPSIANFKNLKALRISNTEPLTDLSLRYAISKLKNLEFLSVTGQKFSEEGIKNLLKSIPHFQLYTDEGKKWGELHCQRDLSKKFHIRPACNEKFANYWHYYY